MYKDYDVIYESNLNENLIYYIILSVIAIALVVLTLIALSRVFKKANRSGISAYIPFYNIYTVIEIANLPKMYFILFLIPFVNIYILYKISMSIAKLFKKKVGFGYGLLFLPFIFYPILAFSDSEYIGINLVAMKGLTTVEDIPVIDENKNNPIEKEVNENEDIGSRGINISIGGGVYQKDYTNSLQNVDSDKLLNITSTPKEEKPKTSNFIVTNKLEENENNNNVVSNQASNSLNIPLVNKESNNNIPTNNVENNPVIVNTTNTITNSGTNPLPIDKPNSNTNSEYRLCPNCGTRVPDGSKMCYICGQTLE